MATVIWQCGYLNQLNKAAFWDKFILIWVLFCETSYNKLKLMKGKALRKHSLHKKTAASVLLKLFISGNE